MVIDQNITRLICILERLIGKECYNPNSYNGWTCEEGCGFRYLVHVHLDELSPNTVSTKGSLLYLDLEPHHVKTIKYKFGSNHLYIGEGLAQVLLALENRYDLDFNQLEEEYQKKQSEQK